MPTTKRKQVTISLDRNVYNVVLENIAWVHKGEIFHFRITDKRYNQVVRRDNLSIIAEITIDGQQRTLRGYRYLCELEAVLAHLNKEFTINEYRLETGLKHAYSPPPMPLLTESSVRASSSLPSASSLKGTNPRKR